MSGILNDVLNQKLRDRYTPKTNNNVGGMRGLLNMVNSPRGQDIATGLLAQSGYSPTPVNLGSAIGQANQYATQNQFKRDANELADISALSTMVSDKNKSNKLSEFQTNINEFNKIDAIPVDQRTRSENNAYKALGKKINMNDSLNELIDDIAVEIANSTDDDKVDLSDKQNQLIKLKRKLSILEQFGFDVEDMDENAGGGDTKDLKKENVKIDISKADNVYTDKNGDKVYQIGDQFVYADGTTY